MTLKETLLNSVAALALAIPVYAQTAQDGEADLATAAAASDERNITDSSACHGMTVGDLVGMDVHATAGGSDENVGEIDDLIQGTDSLEAVIGICRFIGLGEFPVALPLGAFLLDPQNEGTLTIDGFTKEQLEATPEIDESDLEALPTEYLIGG